MAVPFLTAIDLGKNELQNARVQNLASDPSSPVEGQVYWNTTSHVLKLYNGTIWVVIGRLDQITTPTASVAMGSQKITGLLDPTGAQDAATKIYVDNTINGLSWKTAVRVASTANLTVASAVISGAVVDGVTLATGDRILLKNQTAGAENGIYVVVASGAASRSTDTNTAGQILQAAVFVEEGTAAADTAWVLQTNAPITLNTTSLTFAQFGAGAAYTAGTGLALAGSVISIENTGVLLPTHGGTGVATITSRGVVVGQGTAAVTATAAGAAGTVLHGAGGAADPTFSAVSLTVDVSGVLPIANGGTNAATAAAAKTSLAFMTRFAVDIGDGSTTAITVTHNLGTLDALVQVYRKSDGVVVQCDETMATTNTVTLTFATAPTTAQYRAVVIG